MYASERAKLRDEPPTICLPDRLALDTGIVTSILNQEIRNPSIVAGYEQDTSIEVITLNALEARFSCD